MRDPVVTLNSNNCNWELPIDVTIVSANTMEVLLVPGIQNINININNGSGNDLATNNDSNSNMRTTE